MNKEILGRRWEFAGRIALALLLSFLWIVSNVGMAAAQAKATCKEMRKVKLGVSVSPPNVVHTPVYVARALGIFAQHCIEVEIVEFEGGASAANLAAVTQGQALADNKRNSDCAGVKGEADLGHGAAFAAGLHGQRRDQKCRGLEGQAA